MKLHLQSHNERNPNQVVNITGSFLGRSYIHKVGDVLSFISDTTKETIRVIIYEEYKSVGGKESLIVSKKLQVIDGNILIKEIKGPKQFVLSEIKEYKAPVIREYTNYDMFKTYDFEDTKDLVIEASKLIQFIENIEITENNISYLYSEIKNQFNIILKILNKIVCFEYISQAMGTFLVFFNSSHNNLKLEEKIEKINITSLFLKDFVKNFYQFEKEIRGYPYTYTDMQNIEGENDIAKIINKYTGLIKGAIDQASYNIDIIINPENNNYDNQKIEFF